jgi:hypothetical protein
MELARKVCPVLRGDPSIVFAEVYRDDQKREWEGVIERLVAYEDQHGQLPDLVAYPTCETSNNPGDHGA